VIPQIVRGGFMPDLISYLFGLGRYNEHENQHLVAGYGDAVFSEARELGWQVEYPHARWGTEVPHGYVWHCSLSIKAEEGQLTDEQWTEAAHAMVSALGFDGADGKTPCRWVAVRHGLSKEGNDHIHIAVNLVREDGTKASVWRDYKKASAVCADLETRFGLQHLAGRMTGRSVPEPSRADREISAASGEREPLRTRLERKVRACAAAADSEARFIALARKNGLLIRPRYAEDSHERVVGYAVAERDGRQAYSNRTKQRGPVWFGGGKLASDLALPRLRERWQADPRGTTMEALAAWSAMSTTADTPSTRHADRQRGVTDGHLGNAADALAIAATSVEAEAPGPLSEAARRMARAAQEETAPRTPGAAAAVRDMADTFLSVTFADTDAAGTLILTREVARLADACVARAATATAQRESRQASALVHASLVTLTEAAEKQAASTLTTSTRGTGMSEPTHEEELLRTITQTEVLVAQIARAKVSRSTGSGGVGADLAAEIIKLRKAGYAEHTPYDDVLRRLLGEQRWARYGGDEARIAAAASITDADRAGIYDMEKLLTRAVKRRAWEEDPRNPARSVAQILHYRVKTEAAARHPSVMNEFPAVPQSTAEPESKADSSRTLRGDSPAQHPAPEARTRAQQEQPREPVPVTPYDGKLRNLLGEARWQRYADDPRRKDVAALLTKAAAEGRDMDRLLTAVVTKREFEKDPRSPARRVAGVLHYRIQQALADPHDDLPADVAGKLSNAMAPAGSGPRNPSRPDPASQAPPSARMNGRPSDGRDSR
jgi:hypothetical protein